MTKRLTITLVALALFVIIAVLPVSAMLPNPATGKYNGSIVINGTQTPTIFIGETGLNITRVIFAGYGDGSGNTGGALSTKIGWWAPGTFSYPDNPSWTIDVGSKMNNFDVGQNDWLPYLGTWYCLTADAVHANGAAFVVADPYQIVSVWDVRANNGMGQDMTGKSVVRGATLTMKLDTNLAAFTSPGRVNSPEGGKTVGMGVIGTGFAQWNNGTGQVLPGTGGASGSALYSFPITDPSGVVHAGYMWTNASFVPETAVTTLNELTFINFSANTTNVGGWVYVARTYTYNNTGPCVGGAATLQGCGQLTAATSGGKFPWNGTTAPDYLNYIAGSFVPPLPNVGQTGTSLATGWAAPLVSSAYANAPFGNVVTGISGSGDGFMLFRIKDESGSVQSRIFTARGPGTAVGTTSLSNLWVALSPFYLGDFNGVNGLTLPAVGWQTDAVDPGLGINAYPAGTYTVWSETQLSNMKNYYRLSNADYTGKTISLTGTITLVSDTVKIEANKETVVRSKPFSVIITGRPLTQYFVWVKGTSSMDGGYDNQPPMVGLFQAYVYNDTPTITVPAGTPPNQWAYPMGTYQYQNGVTRTIRQDVATDLATNTVGNVVTFVNPYNSTRYYAMINTTSAGTRTVAFVTTNMTKAQTYTIRVEQNFPINTVNGFPTVQAGPNGIPPGNDDFKSDEVDVRVEKGAVTITAAGDQSYYLGEEIKFSGTNTETQNTFLFLTGPNLWPEGSRFLPAAGSSLDPRRSSLNQNSRVVNLQPSTFVQRAVNADNTWDWKWGTANYALDAGTYTVYAVSGPNDALTLANSAYGTVAIIIKKPFVSATASQSTVAQGDKLFIIGTAEGKPQQGIAIWILGKNYALRTTQSVNSDASFSYEVTTGTTTTMDAGQYFVVVQHPMQNQQFDIAVCAPPNANQVCNLQQATAAGGAASATQTIFTLLGAGSLQGTDAAEALVQGINSANVDDTYTKLVFLVEVPVIRIDPIVDRHVGDKFTITATTNLAVDDEVQVTVVSSSFKPTQKTQSGEFSGASGTVKVIKGDTGLNTLSFDVDASTFKPDEYIVTASRILRPAATSTALFNVLEGIVQTAAPTAAATTAGPTQVATTAAPTTVPATPTKTPTQPGFGALVALIGLGAVAFLVVRKH